VSNLEQKNNGIIWWSSTTQSENFQR